MSPVRPPSGPRLISVPQFCAREVCLTNRASTAGIKAGATAKQVGCIRRFPGRMMRQGRCVCRANCIASRTLRRRDQRIAVQVPTPRARIKNAGSQGATVLATRHPWPPDKCTARNGSAAAAGGVQQHASRTSALANARPTRRCLDDRVMASSPGRHGTARAAARVCIPPQDRRGQQRSSSVAAGRSDSRHLPVAQSSGRASASCTALLRATLAAIASQ